MDELYDDTPLSALADSGVVVPFDPNNYQMWLITGRYDGIVISGRQFFIENLNLEFSRRFPNRSTFTGNDTGYQMLTQAKEQEIAGFLEFYKRTVEIWGGDIRLSRKMLISDVRPI